MFQRNVRWCRRVRGCLVGAAVIAASWTGLLIPDAPLAARATDVVYTRIEEDWVMVLNDPEEGRAAPQVVTEMAPAADSLYFGNFHINHRELAQYVIGGLQVQLWKGEANKAYQSYGYAVMASPGEVVTWTQYMQRNEDSHRLKFGIKSGVSTTWGVLDTAGLVVKARHYDEGPDDVALEGYSSDYSVQNSGITFGANRVSVLKLVQVRKYRTDGLIDLELNVRIVHEASEE